MGEYINSINLITSTLYRINSKIKYRFNNIKKELIVRKILKSTVEKKKFHLVRISNIFTFVQDSFDNNICNFPNKFKSSKIYFISWKISYKSKNDKVKLKKSNSRIVRWNNNNWSLIIGRQIFKIYRTNIWRCGYYFLLEKYKINNIYELQKKFESRLITNLIDIDYNIFHLSILEINKLYTVIKKKKKKR